MATLTSVLWAIVPAVLSTWTALAFLLCVPKSPPFLEAQLMCRLFQKAFLGSSLSSIPISPRLPPAALCHCGPLELWPGWLPSLCPAVLCWVWGGRTRELQKTGGNLPGLLRADKVPGGRGAPVGYGDGAELGGRQLKGTSVG